MTHNNLKSHINLAFLQSFEFIQIKLRLIPVLVPLGGHWWTLVDISYSVTG